MPLLSTRLPIIALLALLLLASSACALTRMETANQLEAEQTVMGGSIDNIGYGPIPRVQFYAMQGIADRGDISGHVGTSLLTANAGLGGRFYPTERINLSLQGDISTVLMDLPMTDHAFGDPTLLTAVPRLSTATKGDEFFYAGIQSNIVTELHTDSPQLKGVLGGLILGLDFGSPDEGGGFQGELVLYPAQYQDGNWTFFADLNEGEIILFQISVGGYWSD